MKKLAPLMVIKNCPNYFAVYKLLSKQHKLKVNNMKIHENSKVDILI